MTATTSNSTQQLPPDADSTTSPPYDGNRKRPGPWMRRAQWIIIPLIMFAIIEMATRRELGRHAPWYDHQETWLSQSTERRLDFIFVGSSRVQAAIDIPSFNSVAARRLGREPQAVNLGLGHSTMAEHYLGLRNLIDAAPERFKGTVVFVETVEGLPVHSFPNEQPYTDSQPQLMASVLHARDLPEFWRAEGDKETKILLISRWLLRKIQALKHRERLHETLVRAGSDAFVKVARKLKIIQAAEVADASMSGEGGIKLDPAAMRAAADFATHYAATEATGQTPLRDWDQTIVHELVEKVQRAGGKVVFFDVPMHTLMAAPSHTAVRNEDRQRFAEIAARWRTPMLKSPLETANQDFPDVWHLSLAKSKPYSVALAEAYFNQLVK